MSRRRKRVKNRKKTTNVQEKRKFEKKVTKWFTSVVKNHYLFLIVLIFALISNHSTIIKFRSLPACFYGCDLYYQLGHIYHLYYGGKFTESSSMKSEMPGYLPLYPYLVTLYGKLFHLSPLKAHITFSNIILILSHLIFYILGLIIFKDKYFAVVFTVVSQFGYHPVFKYREFTQLILVPLNIIFLYFAFKSYKIKYFILFGFVFGLTAISHSVMFIGIILLFLYFLFKHFFIYKLRNKINITWYGVFIRILLIILISTPFAMLYLYKPLFQYELKTKYDKVHQDTIDLSQISNQLYFFKQTFTSIFNFSSLIQGIYSILYLFAIIYFFRKRKQLSYEESFILQCLFVSFFITFSYFITEPLFHMNVGSPVIKFYFYFFLNFILVLGVRFIVTLFSNKIENKNMIYFIKLVFLVFIIALLFYHVKISRENNRFWNSAYKDIPEYVLSLQKYLIGNTEVNTIILSTKELSFFVNAFSGRKLFTSRWAQQNNPFLDVARRDLMASIVLYGNNTIDKLFLIKTFNVSYLYWDYYWINSEWQLGANNQVYPYDPLMVFDNTLTRKVLMYYNISFIPQFFWIDPSSMNPRYRRFNLLLISYENYESTIHPWKYDLDPFLEKVWSYSFMNRKIAVLYRFNFTKIDGFLKNKKPSNILLDIVLNESNYYIMNNLNEMDLYYK